MVIDSLPNLNSFSQNITMDYLYYAADFFTSDNIAILQAGKTATPYIHGIASLYSKSEITKAKGGEGTSASHIGIKSEQRGDSGYSLSIKGAADKFKALLAEVKVLKSPKNNDLAGKSCTF